MQYHSQFKQDEFLNEYIFKGKENGFFIEIGADDGVRHSNTLFFEKYKNWKGICVEPRKSAFKELTLNRTCICENVCISEKKEIKNFTEFVGNHSQLSGLSEKYSENHKKRIETETREYGLIKKTIEVECENINNILKKHNVKKIDYMSIDTEGGEIEILKSIDFSNVTIDVISVENNYQDSKIKKYLEGKNYKLIKKLRVDEIYALKNCDLPVYKESFNAKSEAKKFKHSIFKWILKLTPRPLKNSLKDNIRFRNSKEKIKFQQKE